MNEIIIKKAKWKLYGSALMSGLLIIFFFIGPFDHTQSMYADSPKWTIALAIVFFLVFIGSVGELITREEELIFTEHGLEIRNQGWNPWESIQSFRTILETDSENGDKKYLIIQLKDLTEIKYDASELDVTLEEIGYLLKQFKPDIEHIGHKVK